MNKRERIDTGIERRSARREDHDPMPPRLEQPRSSVPNRVLRGG